ncbi:MAG: glutathione S-transferase family protein [Geminicoccaceae bacterium]
MTDCKLIIGNKTYSSWSLRGWLAVKQAGIPFEELLVNLGDPDFKQQLKRHSPAAKVPVLIHGDRMIWDTMAIIEYLAEICPEAGIWPVDQGRRAEARSVAAEMHASFAAIRESMPMNLSKSLPGRGRNSGVEADIRRIGEIWRGCRRRFADQGAFLFGPWCAADTMFAPIVTRLRTYGVDLDQPCEHYAAAVLSSAWFKEWETAALKEPWIVTEDEID